jgi:hypothetical protein
MNNEEDDKKTPSGKTECLKELVALGKDIEDAIAKVRSMSASEYRKAEQEAVERYGPDLLHAVLKNEDQRILVFQVSNEFDWPQMPSRFTRFKKSDAGKLSEGFSTGGSEPQMEQTNSGEMPNEEDTFSTPEKPNESTSAAYRNTIRVLNEKNDRLTKMLEMQIRVNLNQIEANRLLLEMGQVAGNLLKEST